MSPGMSQLRIDTNAAAPATSSPTIRSRLSLFLQLAPPGISKSKPTYPRRSLTPGKRSPREKGESAPSSAVASVSDRPLLDAAAASTVSIVDSLASAPHDSLLFKSQSTDVLLPPLTPLALPVPVPPTTNDLDYEEKMRLLKKVRKLSRVLGEYPLPVGLDDVAAMPSPVAVGDMFAGSVPSSPRSAPKTPQTQRRSFRHSWTVGFSAGASPLRTDEIDSPDTPSSPIEFAKPKVLDRNAKSGTSSRSRSFDMTDAGEDEPMDVDLDSPTRPRRMSTGSASILLPEEKTPEQVQRARAARITRHLGDEVPPEILFRAASPPPPRPSSVTPPHSAPIADHMPLPLLPPVPADEQGLVLDSRTLPRRSASLRRKRGNDGAGRRLSLDLKALHSASSTTSIASAPPSRSVSSSGTKGTMKSDRKSMKRTRSLWVRKVFPDGDKTDNFKGDSPSPVRESFDAAKDPISERERLLNVKRAKKMTQYFGDQPPTALFQITNFSHDVSDDNTQRLRRDSLATIISISSSLAQLDGRAVRDSYMSMSSVLSPPAEDTKGKETKADIILAQQEEDKEERPSVDSSAQGSELSETQYEFPLPPSTPQSAGFGLSPPHSPPGGSTTVSVYHAPYHEPASPRTPPPFSDSFVSAAPHSPPRRSTSKPSPPRPSTSHGSSDAGRTSVEFHTRQKRAVKLSKFFGVEMNTLAEVLPTNPRQSGPADTRHDHHPRRGSDHSVSAASDDAPAMTVVNSLVKPDITVEISAEPAKGGPLRFLHGQASKELDMYDAIDKLRRMKSM